MIPFDTIHLRWFATPWKLQELTIAAADGLTADTLGMMYVHVQAPGVCAEHKEGRSCVQNSCLV